jgi:hypothetical protein
MTRRLDALAVVAAVLTLGAGGVDAAQLRQKLLAGFTAQPSMRPWRLSDAPNPDGWWCRGPACRTVDGGVVARREIALMAKLGARVLRLEFPWPLIESRKGAFDWRRSDYLVALARRHGLQTVPVLVYTPSWAATDESNPPPRRAFAAFAGAFASRYRERIHYYELWNEANHARYWTGTRREYVERVLVPGSRAVKRADRTARVVLSGPTDVDAEWLHGIYSDGGGSAFDVMAFHNYSGDRRTIDAARAVQRILEAHGQGRKPLWLGEYGVEASTPADGRQSALVRTVLRERSPLAVALWYTLRDDHVMTCCPPRTLFRESYGLVTDGGVPKPAYATMKRELARLRR